MEVQRCGAKRLSAEVEPGTSTDGPPTRRRRPPEAESSPGQAGSPPEQAPDRPTPAESDAADAVIAAMKSTVPIPILGPNTVSESKVVACALALYFGQPFKSDCDAKDAFNVGRTTD
eukprot:4295219-Prymnesium_polylepis.1